MRLLDEQSGVTRSGSGPINKNGVSSGSGCNNLNRNSDKRHPRPCKDMPTREG